MSRRATSRRAPNVAPVGSGALELLVRLTLRRRLHNLLTDQHAQTALGALRDRLEKRLERDERFRRASAKHVWCLDRVPLTVGTDDVSSLIAVAQRRYVTYYRNRPAHSVAQLQRARTDECRQRVVGP